ncbi:RuvC family protein [Propionispora hippei]|uniref:RNase H-fold protein, predicted Holliday junction resolvase n=1 Tax=Propionispora hippei DSM 15287 TaxID=1123003 RepID=A0A1M6K4Z0_9FIRM|nr:pre-16S rRNA-processing nuclease YqgF [Propionispora hippei]SHJ54026.1 RNase H-fold protein, predicted Holliday junction resolvase [Propionispora hippei DSM 15287]
MADFVVAVDPGREKCGVAVMSKADGALWQGVIATEQLTEKIRHLAMQYGLTTLVLGDRTSSGKAKEALADLLIEDKKLEIVSVDEHHSTELARQYYWREHPPRGLKRLIPLTMQVPPVPVDDYVAVILAERYFAAGN